MLWRYAGMGVELAASIIGLTLLGLWVDHRYGTAPTGLLVGVGIGVVGGLYNFMRAALRISRSPQAAQRKEDTCKGNDRHD